MSAAGSGSLPRGLSAPHSPAVPLLDIGRGNSPLREEILAAITRVVDSGKFLHGPDVAQLERTTAELCGVEHAIACASGSDALLLALMALDIGPGHEVIVPSFTFFATASAVWRVGARPVFTDIDPRTFNLDPNKIEAAITPKTRAIIPVHLFGQCCEMDAINDLARRRRLFVIEDAAQAIGAKYWGRPACSLGAIGCLSFYPTKNLGAFGDAGMLTTSDADLAQRLRLYAAHGMNPRYYHKVVGINSRLDTIQAAVLNVKLARLAQWADQRKVNARRYHDLLTAAGLAGLVVLPHGEPHCEHVWNQYTIRITAGRRDAVKAQLADAGVGSEIYYPVPLHLQDCFRPLGYKSGSLPETERAAKEVLSLPIFPELTAAEQQTVVARLGDIVARPAAKAA
ncbi:MAG: DegT/DnrJ/EryC1/StrS family aminotransferase [Planctomycetaceae bacterium]|nr:DegT/DnrJ/EryC1/StrS family aminotransferase [Planctomycetaceae bacterium]